tara:strand:+ start:236 stop:2944 length:2709 start_codon:yes stop_codon:yes gene_type:complete
MVSPLLKAIGATGAAAAALQPEDAEAGLLNQASKALRESIDIAKRTELDELGIGRGERKVQKVVQLNAQEKQNIRDSISGKNIKEIDAFNLARDFKKRHPRSDWTQPEVTGVEQNDSGDLKLLLKKIPYEFNKNKQGKFITPGSPAFNKISDNLANEIIEIERLSRAGDPSATRIMNNAGWYKNVESRMRSEYGSFSQMMGDILGATSPNTPVATNFRFSQDILQRATRGDFDELMNGFADALDRRYALQDEAASYLETQQAAGRFLKDAKLDPYYLQLEDQAKNISRNLQANANTIKQIERDPKTGALKNYGINSYNAMIALADRWRVLRPGQKPKAKNFAANLTGRSEQATIDVWSARNLRRHAGQKPIPSMAEGSVTGNIVDAENFRNSLEFGFGQDVIADATSKINAATGLGLDPRDVQALQWFAEKDFWTKRGWTSTQGEGGSFETMMDKDPVESLFLGLSRDQTSELQGNDFTPTPAESERTAKEILAAGATDQDIRARKGLPTRGAYMGKPETAMDIDIISNQDMLPVDVLDAATRQAVTDQQDSFFIARRQDELGALQPGLFNVGTEIYFKDPVEAGSPLIKKIESRLLENDLPAYTMVVDPRDANSVVGMRILDVPQFANPGRFATISSQDYDRYVREQFQNFDQIGNALRSEFPQIANANPSYYDVNVKSKRASEKYLEQLENDEVDLDAQRQDFYGFKPARERFEEFYREAGMADQGGGTSPGPGQQGSIDPRLAATLPSVGLLGAAATEPTTQEKLQGILDVAANVGQALTAPAADAPYTLTDALKFGLSDSFPFVTGFTNTPEEVRARQAERFAQMDFQPGALGQQYTENAQRAIGSAINNSNILNALGNVYNRSRILQTPERAIRQSADLLPDRARVVGGSILSALGL